MNKLLLSTLLFFTTMVLVAQVGIGIENPDASSILEIKSTTKGFLPPRIADETSIANPAEGLVIFNTTENCLQVNTGTPASPVWTCLGGGDSTGGGSVATPANTVAGYTSNNSGGLTSACANVQPQQIAIAEPNLSMFLTDSDLATGYGSTTKTTGNHVRIDYATEVLVNSVVVGFGEIPCWTTTNQRRRITSHVLEYFDEDTQLWVTIEDGFDDTNTPDDVIRTIQLSTPITAKSFRLGAINESVWIRISEFYVQ